MPVTKEQWDQIEQQLSGTFGTVELECDGHKINAQVQQNKMKLVVAVYVNGYMEFKHMFNKENSEIPRKFWQEKKRHICSAKYRALLLKQSKSRVWSKEERAKMVADANSTRSHFEPWWPNATSLCRHLRKTCTSIEVVKIGY